MFCLKIHTLNVVSSKSSRDQKKQVINCLTFGAVALFSAQLMCHGITICLGSLDLMPTCAVFFGLCSFYAWILASEGKQHVNVDNFYFSRSQVRIIRSLVFLLAASLGGLYLADLISTYHSDEAGRLSTQYADKSSRTLSPATANSVKEHILQAAFFAPNNPQRICSLADQAYMLGMGRLGDQLAERALNLNPQNKFVYHEIMRMMAMYDTNISNIRTIAERALKLNPHFAEAAFIQRADIYAKLGYEKAAQTDRLKAELLQSANPAKSTVRQTMLTNSEMYIFPHP